MGMHLLIWLGPILYLGIGFSLAYFCALRSEEEIEPEVIGLILFFWPLPLVLYLVWSLISKLIAVFCLVFLKLNERRW